MAHSTITGTVTQTVTLGEAGYDNRIHIEAGGSVRPSLAGAAGIVDPAGVRGHITNDGQVYGAFGAYSGTAEPGGIGIDFYATGTLVNAGTIMGATSGYGGYYAGAIGVDLRKGGEITNQGVIRGGSGTKEYFNSTGGGAGIALHGGTLINSGDVYGGGGPGAIYYSGAGGASVLASAGARIVNSGTLSGGAGGSGYRYGVQGGTGVQLDGAYLTNADMITGGHGGSTGDEDGYGVSGGGGAGVTLHGGTLTNTGTIIGGAGGSAYRGYNSGAVGGAGVEVSGGTLIAGGIIQGGASGIGGIRPAGGAGISVLGGEVIATGTITGGYNNGNALDAVDFGSNTGSLVIDPGAVFNGTVAANAADLLVLGGTDTATLTGLGTEFANFGTVQIAAGASWVLNGPNALSANLTVQLGGILSVAGSLTESGSVTLAAGSILNSGMSGAVLVADVTLQGGRLDESRGSRLAVGNSLAGDTAGTLLVEDNATVAGDGTISADVISVAGRISAEHGTLTLHGPTSGAGTVTIAAGATLAADGILSVTNLDLSGAGATLMLGKPAEVTSQLSGFGTGDVVDLEKLTATTFTYAGGTLTLLNGAQIVDTLSLAGSYTASDFTLQSDGSTGTDLLYAGTQAPEHGDVSPSYLQIAKAGSNDPGCGFMGHWQGGGAWTPAWLSAGLFGHMPG